MSKKEKKKKEEKVQKNEVEELKKQNEELQKNLMKHLELMQNVKMIKKSCKKKQMQQ